MRKYSIKGHFYKHKQQGKPRMLKTRRLSWPRSGTQCPWAHLIMEVFLVWYLANSRFDLEQVISALKAYFLSCQRKRYVFKKKKTFKVLVCKYNKIIIQINDMILNILQMLIYKKVLIAHYLLGWRISKALVSYLSDNQWLLRRGTMSLKVCKVSPNTDEEKACQYL